MLMDSTTGKAITDYEHLTQSIIDILTTPIGSRIARREYGSNLFELVDQPVNRDWVSRVYIAIASAIDKWEPRIVIESINIYNDIEAASNNQFTFDLSGFYLPNGQSIKLEGLSIRTK